jgi:hypothetical protein
VLGLVQKTGVPAGVGADQRLASKFDLPRLFRGSAFPDCAISATFED